MRVLEIDDSESMLTMLEEMLAVYGHTAVMACDYIGAMDALDKGGVEMVLVDGTFPYAPGHEPEPLWANIAVICDDYGLPYVVMSGRDEIVARANHRGMIAILKPFTMEDMASAIEAARIQCRQVIA